MDFRSVFLSLLGTSGSVPSQKFDFAIQPEKPQHPSDPEEVAHNQKFNA